MLISGPVWFTLGSFKVAFSGRCWDWLPFRHVFGSVSKPSKGGICWSLSSWVEFLIRKGSCWSERITGEEASQALSSSNIFSIFVIKSIGHVDKVHTNPWIFFVKNRFVGGMFPGSYGSDFESWIQKMSNVWDPKLQCLILSKLSLLLTVPYSFFTKHNFFWKKSSCFLVASTFGCLLPKFQYLIRKRQISVWPVARCGFFDEMLRCGDGEFLWEMSTSGVKTHQVIQAVTFLSTKFWRSLKLWKWHFTILKKVTNSQNCQAFIFLRP